MDYFDDLHFTISGREPHCQAEVDTPYPFYAINYAHAGLVRWTNAQGQDRNLRGPVAWWMWPGHHYRFGNLEGRSWSHNFVCFTGPRVQRWVRGGLFLDRKPDEAIQEVRDAGAFRSLFDQVVNVLQGPSPTHHRAILIVEAMLLQLQEERTQASVAQDKRHAQIAALAARIAEKPHLSWDMNAEAGRLALSTVHFRRLFHRFTGRSPVAHVQMARLTTAAALLRQGDQSVKQIADAVGIPDVYYFTRLFKREFGIGPAGYRRL